MDFWPLNDLSVAKIRNRFVNRSVNQELGCTNGSGGHLKDDNSGSGSWSRRPLAAPRNTPVEVEEIVKMISFKLYNQDLFCGVHAAPKHRLKKPETGNGAEWP